MSEFTKKEILVQALKTVKKIDEEVDLLLSFVEEETGKDYSLSTLQIAVSITLSELLEDLEAMGGS